MANFTETHTIEVAFDAHDVRNVSLDGGSYSHRITVNCADGKQVTLKFQPGKDMIEFIETLITAATKADWDSSYPSAYMYPTDERISTNDVKRWKEEATPDSTE